MDNNKVTFSKFSDTPSRGGRCTLNMSRLKRPPVGVVRKLIEGEGSQIIFCANESSRKWPRKLYDYDHELVAVMSRVRALVLLKTYHFEGLQHVKSVEVLLLALAKEARDIEHKCTTITLDDANAVAKHRIMNHTFKKPLVTEFDCPRIITSTIARLRTEHLKGMKIHSDKTRSYVQCKHCPDLQLTPNHILECPTVATKLLKIGMVPLRDSLRELLYSPDAPRIAEAVIKTFDGI
ncbi:hypothetical protein TNCV_4867911 [Trichonephila clavipes]|nr:hypothetical protein TNCV_4867911 [Trichonephila clavipes]